MAQGAATVGAWTPAPHRGSFQRPMSACGGEGRHECLWAPTRHPRRALASSRSSATGRRKALRVRKTVAPEPAGAPLAPGWSRTSSRASQMRPRGRAGSEPWAARRQMDVLFEAKRGRLGPVRPILRVFTAPTDIEATIFRWKGSICARNATIFGRSAMPKRLGGPVKTRAASYSQL